MADETIRMSQVVGVFGPGAMLDLPERSVVVGGLERWDTHAPGAFRTIEEPRLARLLHQRLAGDPRLGGDRPPDLRTPPVDPNDRRVTRPPAIEAPVFPEWFVCDAVEGDAPGRRRLVRFSDLKPPARKEHVADDGKRRRASPVRFVCGCTKGHLQDIEWRRILHADGATCREQMWLVDTSTSGDPRDTRIVCDCGVPPLTLEDLSAPKRLGVCRGERPWIGDRDPQPCDAPKGLNLLTRSATNTYFPQVATVISLPPSEDELSRRIEQHWSVLQKARSADWLDIAREANAAVGAALEGYSNEEVWARIQALAAGVGGADQAKDPRLAEFELFSSGRVLIGENSSRALLHAETLDRQRWDPGGEPVLSGIASLVAVHRLREVSCLYGFTRFEPAALANDDLEDVGLAVEGAPLGRSPSWLPAVESFGEGFFLLFDPEALKAWLARPALRERARALEAGVSSWERARRQRGLQADRSILGERVRPEYVMAHSLAHALMTEVALDCGYPASSLKERIYVPPRGPNEKPQAGILVYTASAGMQGTLGGLVEVTGRFARVLRLALERLELCSGDPVCADHEPSAADEDRALHGAACHGCLLVAETSCEARNLHLDRALLVDTVGAERCGFFA
ncbi:DUF1998 domain-containing protein [Falsiroseomonas oryzae]|uniref:DUF1998 domain-containing protein n=1 Tax=Falsiroseomonas oryzae TaxID=2766473 RepID=UPI0022EAF299|nr:DUF1998 domain-containing protein [Roseomonas sp. MO-31]